MGSLRLFTMQVILYQAFSSTYCLASLLTAVSSSRQETSAHSPGQSYAAYSKDHVVVLHHICYTSPKSFFCPLAELQTTFQCADKRRIIWPWKKPAIGNWTWTFPQPMTRAFALSSSNLPVTKLPPYPGLITMRQRDSDYQTSCPSVIRSNQIGKPSFEPPTWIKSLSWTPKWKFTEFPATHICPLLDYHSKIIHHGPWIFTVPRNNAK